MGSITGGLQGMGQLGGGNREAPGRDLKQSSDRSQQQMDEFLRMAPIVPNVDVTGLNELQTTLDRLNAYKKLATQREMRPDVAAGEALVDKSMLSDAAEYDAGRVPHGGQSALARLGLGGAINTGAGLGSTFGKQTAASIFGREFEGKRMAAMDRLARWIAGNPAPDIGMSGSTASGIQAKRAEDIANVLNPRASNLLQLAMQSEGNAQNKIGAATQAGLHAEAARKAANEQKSTMALQAMAKSGMFCWVAEEIFGIDSEKTHTIRAFMKQHVDDNGWLGDFAHLYQQEGRDWAAQIRVDPVQRATAELFWNALCEMAQSEKHQPVEV